MRRIGCGSWRAALAPLVGGLLLAVGATASAEMLQEDVIVREDGDLAARASYQIESDGSDVLIRPVLELQLNSRVGSGKATMLFALIGQDYSPLFSTEKTISVSSDPFAWAEYEVYAPTFRVTGTNAERILNEGAAVAFRLFVNEDSMLPRSEQEWVKIIDDFQPVARIITDPVFFDPAIRGGWRFQRVGLNIRGAGRPPVGAILRLDGPGLGGPGLGGPGPRGPGLGGSGLGAAARIGAFGNRPLPLPPPGADRGPGRGPRGDAPRPDRPERGPRGDRPDAPPPPGDRPPGDRPPRGERPPGGERPDRPGLGGPERPGDRPGPGGPGGPDRPGRGGPERPDRPEPPAGGPRPGGPDAPGGPGAGPGGPRPDLPSPPGGGPGGPGGPRPDLPSPPGGGPGGPGGGPGGPGGPGGGPRPDLPSPPGGGPGGPGNGLGPGGGRGLR